MSKAYLTYAATPIVLALSTLSVGGTCLVAQEHIRQSVVEVPAPQNYSTIVEVHIRPGVLSAQDAATPRPLRWAVAPPLLPPGALIAVVTGDPTGPGESTILLSMPDGYRMPPHFHPTDERVEVKQGTLLVGMGDRLDVGKTMALATGDTIVAPAGFHHYSIAQGTTVVSVRFIGPYTITYVHSYQAPRQPSFPYGY